MSTLFEDNSGSNVYIKPIRSSTTGKGRLKPQEYVIKPKYDSVHTRVQKLIRFDKIRLLRILETVVYTIVYVLISFVIGTFIDQWFPNADETKSSAALMFEVIAQIVFLVITFFYLHKLVRIIPLHKVFTLFDSSSDYHFGKQSESFGSVAISIVFMSTQSSIGSKLDILSRRFKSTLNMI